MGLFDFFKRKSNAREEEKSSPVNIVSGHSIAERVDLTSEIIERVSHRFIAFDVETTGLSPETDRIVELGAVLFVDAPYGRAVFLKVPDFKDFWAKRKDSNFVSKLEPFYGGE